MIELKRISCHVSILQYLSKVFTKNTSDCFIGQFQVNQYQLRTTITKGNETGNTTPVCIWILGIPILRMLKLPTFFLLGLIAAKLCYSITCPPF